MKVPTSIPEAIFAQVWSQDGLPHVYLRDLSDWKTMHTVFFQPGIGKNRNAYSCYKHNLHHISWDLWQP